MDGETFGQRIAELGRHGGKHRALDMAIAVQKRMDEAKPAERVSQGEQLSEIGFGGFVEVLAGVLEQLGSPRVHFVGRTKLEGLTGAPFTGGGDYAVSERTILQPAIIARVDGVAGWNEGRE